MLCGNNLLHLLLVSGADLDGGKLEREVVGKTGESSRREGEEWNSPIFLLAVGNNSASGSSCSSSGKEIGGRDEFLWTHRKLS